MVDALVFRGNHAISSRTLASIIATDRASIWLRWFGWRIGSPACVDSAGLPIDALRISDLYRQRGYPGTVVTASLARHDDRRVRVIFQVKESIPLRVDSVVVDSVPRNAGNVDQIRKFFRGWVLDDSVFTATIDSLQTAIRDVGYVHARPPDTAVVRDTIDRRASVSAIFHPGHMTYVGKITIATDSTRRKPALDDAQIRPLLSIKEGDRYTARRIGQSQRDLYELELYRAVRIDADTTPHDTSDTIPLRVRLVEGDRRRLRLGGGWGTLDCFRTQARIVDEKPGSRAATCPELNGRLSKIGLAQPFTGLSDLCAPSVRSDPYSQNLNYYAGATLNLRGIPGAIYKPTITLYSSRISQVGAYEQTTDIGVVTSISRTLAPRFIATAQYQFTNSHTVADGAVSCTTPGIGRFEDLTAFSSIRARCTAWASAWAKNPLTPTEDPVNGQRWQGDVREEYTIIAHTTALFFTRMSAEAAIYRPIGDFLVVAVHGQAGYIAAANDAAFLIPPAERFYSGGQSSVRGYDENLLGPGSYIVPQPRDTITVNGKSVGIAQASDGYSRIAPSGGNIMWLANVELRSRHGWPTEILRWVLFVDAGRVWNTNDAFNVTNASARVTPGVGVRLVTPIGPFRVDIGYNPYGYTAGPAYYLQAANTTTGVAGRAICVSPGTTDPLALPSSGVGAASCPATYVPMPRNGLLSHLAFHFSIGQAF